jgi:membrane fusion protein
LIPVGATLQAHLYAPSSALGFLRSGQSVQLRLQAFPYQKYGGLAGQVLQVAQAPMPAAELGGALLAPSALGGEPFYRVLVALPQQAWRVGGRPVPLLAGMQLEADVMLERRRLIEWMLAPLWGWRQR